MFTLKVSENVKSYNPLKIFQVVCLLLCLGGLGWLGFNLMTQNTQIRQFKTANRLLSKQKYAKAIAIYDRLLSTEAAQNHLLWINRGYAYSGLKQYQEMRESCAKATKLNYQAAVGWNCQGEALYYLDRDRAALAALEQAIAINPKEITFWLNKSRVLSNLQQHTQAIAASKEAIKLGQKLSPQNRAVKTNLAIAYNRQGQALLKIGQDRAALKAFESSLEYSPQYLSPQQGKGIVLYQLQQYSQAIETFEQILQREDLTAEQQAVSWLYLGINLCQNTDKGNIPSKNIAAARQAFERVLELTEKAELRTIARAGCGIR